MDTRTGISTLLIITISFSFLLSFPITFLLYKFKITRRGEVDFSNLIEERQKKIGTPIMGGLIVVLAVLILNFIFNINTNGQLYDTIRIPLLIFTISALLGAFDDVLNIYGHERKVERIHRIIKLIRVHKSVFSRMLYVIKFPWLVYKRIFFLLGSNPGKGIQAHEKVLVQAITGIILGIAIVFDQVSISRFANLSPTAIWVPIFEWIDIGILMIPFATFVVISMANAVNLSDGMDGLAAGLLLPAFAGLFVIAIVQGDLPNMILLTTIIGSLITYLYFNIPPARFQMGDVGSLALGTIFAAIGFSMHIPLLLPVIGFPFVAEVASALLQGIFRRFLGRRLLLMAPLHHHFEMKGWSEEKVVMRFWIFGIICAVFGVWIYLVKV